ncbi:MAG: DUF4835 family protein [Candidatus Kapaibacterium sp.]|nr:DUF4835 family protein [Ignavibacteriota bacterium]MCB9220958.1 DUF4835 family protein [Ignavibacteria bacterium]
MRKLLFTLVFLVFGMNIFAQEIEADVTVNVEMLDQDKRISVSTMENDLERYINSTRFTDIEWEGKKIPVDISIALTGGYNNRYNAKLFIASKRYLYGQEEGTSVVLKIADNEWSFEYAQGAYFDYNTTRYNEFSSLIDFYMLTVIGFDMDTYETLGGNSAFNIARRIAGIASTEDIPGFKTFIQPGEFTKYALISELTDLRYEDLRILFFEYYVDGLDMMAEDKDKGLENLRKIIGDIVDYKQNKMTGPSVLLQVFTDSKAFELGATFEGYKDQSVFKDLKYIDPSNTTLYERHENK